MQAASNLKRRAIGVAAVAVMLSGCSGSQTGIQAHGLLPGGGWVSDAARAKNTHLMYVSSPNGNTVDIFAEYGKNSPPIGEITDGIVAPTGMTVNKYGDLYVANSGNDTVTVYARGSISPSKTYSLGLAGRGPAAVAVGSDGTVYVSCNLGFVVEYPPGGTSPTRTFSLPDAYFSGIALDAKGNLYVAYQTHGPSRGVYEYAKGSASSGKDLGLHLALGFPHGLAFDRAGDLLVVDCGAPSAPSAVYVYPPGSKTASRSFTGHIGQPFSLALDLRGERLFLADNVEGGKHGTGSVHEYRFSDGKELTSESRGVAGTAHGVALDPPEQFVSSTEPAMR